MSLQTPSPPLLSQQNKIFYIDNLKIFLTVLVIVHHSIITYGASGGWYYKENTTSLGALIPMTMFVATNQSFFMGFFFMIAAFFSEASYNRKGARKFTSDRLLKLGIPLLFYSFFFSPLLSYLVYYFAKGNYIGYLEYLGEFDGWIDFGVLWFVAALLLFTLIYILWRGIAKVDQKASTLVPGTKTIILFAIVLGVISFSIRVRFPVGWVLKPLGFQLGHFTQYISLYIVGLIAYRNNWFEQLTARTGKQLGICAILFFLFFPVFYILKVRLDFPLAWYSGGLHWQSLSYAVWEQCIGVSILTSLLALAKQFWNHSSAFLSRLARSTFAVYIFHPLIVISLSLIMRNWTVDPAIKLLIVAPLAVLGSFLFGSMVLLIPWVKKIL